MLPIGVGVGDGFVAVEEVLEAVTEGRFAEAMVARVVRAMEDTVPVPAAPAGRLESEAMARDVEGWSVDAGRVVRERVVVADAREASARRVAERGVNCIMISGR